MSTVKAGAQGADLLRMRRWLRVRLLDEGGMALVMAIGITTVLAIAGTAAMTYSTSSSTQSAQSRSRANTFSLAEAGINNSMAVLMLPTNDALDPDTLPKCTTNETKYGTVGSIPTAQSTWRHDSYGSGSVDWCGTLNRSQAQWFLTSIGLMKNPGGKGNVSRMLQATVSVTPTNTQPLNNPAWNYIYARATGSTCDVDLANNLSGSSQFYVAGNLCLSNNVSITSTSLIVRGNLDLGNNAQVGASTSMSTRVETYVGGNCRYGGGTWATPCTGNQDSRKIYSKRDPPSYVVGVNNAAPVIPEPAADFSSWYEHAIPGPSQSCTTSSGTPPTFDTNYPTRDNSVSTVFELTPASSYTCRVGPAGSPSGEISWNASTKVLTVTGTIYIDGSAKISNSSLNQYNGQATIYLSGTFLISNSSKLCGGVSGSDCDFANWDPNLRMLTIVADGNGGQAGAGNSILMDNNGQFQGGLFGTSAIDFRNNSRSDGPIVGSTVKFNNNVQNDQFPTITTVPVGMPGNPKVYAQPNPPQMFTG
jgi:Tfp pilus assembly protein PilX